jgi:transposase
MLKMVDVEFIRKKHAVEGWSIRALSRQLMISRQAVRKALRSSEPPRYQLTSPRPSPVLGPWIALVSEWLEADKTAPRKQRHTARRVYDRLVDEHAFVGAESSVRRLVAQLRPKLPDVFIPLEAPWGQQVQVDWGQAKVLLAGTLVVIHLFCLRLRASGVPFVWAAPTEKLEAFLEGHRRAFEWLGGVPAECWYDNPKTAVVRILAGPERDEHTRFSSLRAHYLFESRFCGPRKPHEKGSVENLVGYVRRNTLVPVPSFPSWEALNAHLLRWCERERSRARERFESDQAALRPLPAYPHRCSITRLVPVSRLALVTFDRSRYSVPCRRVGRTVRLEAFTDHIEVWDGVECIATHERSSTRGHSVLELDHYLPAIERKPRAVANAAVVARMPAVFAEARERLCAQAPDGYREFAAILLLHREFPAQAVADAVAKAMATESLRTESVRQLLLNHTASVAPAPALVPDTLASVRIPPPNITQYDALLEVAS